MSSALLNDNAPVGARFTLITASQGTMEVFVGAANVAPPYTPLVFTVSDDDGGVAANSSLSRQVAALGILLAKDKVIGVYSNNLAAGSGLTVLGSIPADDFVQLTYNNGTSGGSTNGPTTYTIFVARFP